MKTFESKWWSFSGRRDLEYCSQLTVLPVIEAVAMKTRNVSVEVSKSRMVSLEKQAQMKKIKLIKVMALRLRWMMLAWLLKRIPNSKTANSSVTRLSNRMARLKILKFEMRQRRKRKVTLSKSRLLYKLQAQSRGKLLLSFLYKKKEKMMQTSGKKTWLFCCRPSLMKPGFSSARRF